MKLIFKKMVENSRNKACIISFGLGLTTYNCSVGDNVPVYVSGAFSQNNYILNQNETNNTVTIDFYKKDKFGIKNTTTTGTATSIYTDLYNNKNRYFLLITNTETCIYWDNITNRWVFSLADFINYTIIEFDLAYLYTENNYPISNLKWIPRPTDLLTIYPLNSITNTTAGGFKFPAVNSKEIQVEMQNKNGTILKSNKINLIVTP